MAVRPDVILQQEVLTFVVMDLCITHGSQHVAVTRQWRSLYQAGQPLSLVWCTSRCHPAAFKQRLTCCGDSSMTLFVSGRAQDISGMAVHLDVILQQELLTFRGEGLLDNCGGLP